MFGKMRKRFLRMAANVDAGGDNPQDESVQYALEALENLSAVEELLHVSDEPEEIAMEP